MKKKTEKAAKMNIGVLGKIADMIKEISSLARTVVESADSDKYAYSVETLNKGVSDTYEQMRLLIMNSDKFSDEEKLERLAALAEQESESKRKCGEAIKGNRENVANIALEVAKGLLTCGISFVPGIAKELKLLGNKQKALEQQKMPDLLIDTTSEVVDIETSKVQ